MIAEDIISFIRSDLQIYGSLLTLLLVLILWVVFRQWQWVVLPLVICLGAVVAATGTFGFFGKEVTVLSSNFISLQLIITISLVLHLIVRYRELSVKYPLASQRKLVLNTVLSKFNPSLFAIITTIAGFSSLIYSDIRPVIDLGIMMSIAIALSLILAFLLFASLLILSKKIEPKNIKKSSGALMQRVAEKVIEMPKAIYVVAIVAVVFSTSGASKLIVENSFIDYFKSSTEIYQGMAIIDEKLGGTTPLDVIIDFKAKEDEASLQSFEDDDFGFGFDDFEDEFSQSANDPRYWFSSDKLRTIHTIQEFLESIEALGDIQSLATLLRVGKELNGGKDLDSFQLALLYDNIPQEYIDMVLSPYLSIEENQIRYATRVIDTTKDLRRDELLKEIQAGIENLGLDNVESVRLGNLMVMYNNMLQSLFQSQIMTLGVVAIILFMMFLILFRSLCTCSYCATYKHSANFSNFWDYGVVWHSA